MKHIKGIGGSMQTLFGDRRNSGEAMHDRWVGGFEPPTSMKQQGSFCQLDQSSPILMVNRGFNNFYDVAWVIHGT